MYLKLQSIQSMLVFVLCQYLNLALARRRLSLHPPLSLLSLEHPAAYTTGRNQRENAGEALTLLTLMQLAWITLIRDQPNSTGLSCRTIPR